MGFFSWVCQKCGEPIMSSYALTRDTAFLSDVVVVRRSGNVLRGPYDGYGQVDGTKLGLSRAPKVVHSCCYADEGFKDLRPAKWDRLQGFFYSPKEVEAIAQRVRKVAGIEPQNEPDPGGSGSKGKLHG